MPRPRKRLPRMRDPVTGKPICGAKKRGAEERGEICYGTPMANGRCRHHGGKVPRGPKAGSFKHGRSSATMRALPEKLRDAYEETMKDPQPLSLLNEAAILDARTTELLDQVEIRESDAGWRSVLDLVAQGVACADELSDEVPPDALGPLYAILDSLEGLARKGLGDRETWAEIYDVMDQRRKITKTEFKRIEASEKNFDRKQMVTFVGWFVNLLVEHVRDRAALSTVLAEVEKALDIKDIGVERGIDGGDPRVEYLDPEYAEDVDIDPVPRGFEDDDHPGREFVDPEYIDDDGESVDQSPSDEENKESS